MKFKDYSLFERFGYGMYVLFTLWLLLELPKIVYIEILPYRYTVVEVRKPLYYKAPTYMKLVDNDGKVYEFRRNPYKLLNPFNFEILEEVK